MSERNVCNRGVTRERFANTVHYLMSDGVSLFNVDGISLLGTQSYGFVLILLQQIMIIV